MCHQTKCQTCKKASWAGCGMHTGPIFKRIPFEKRCMCGKTPEQVEYAKAHPESKEAIPKGQSCIIQ